MRTADTPSDISSARQRQRSPRAIRVQLIVTVTLTLTVAFLSTNLINYELARRALKESVIARELPLTGDTIYSEIQADLVRPIFISSLMAHDTFLRDWIIEGEKDPEKIRRYLEEIRRKYDVFTAFLVSERTRIYYHFTGVSKKVTADEPRDAWFFRARKMEKPYEINVDPNQQQGDKTTIFINYKVKDYDDNLIGVAGVGLDLQSLAHAVNQYRDDFRRNVYFANRSGRITLHPDRAVAYQRDIADMPGLAPIADQVAASDRGAFEYEAGDDTILLTTRYIPELDWVLLVEQRASVATAPAKRGLTTTVLIGLAAILVSGVAVAWTISYFQRRLEAMATKDQLTGLYNRQVFDASLDQAIVRARRTGGDLSLVLLDIDHFKAFNDRLGHLHGDELLKRTAPLLRDGTRKSDVIARWGGEEFTILMENCSEADAARTADKLRRRIAEEAAADAPVSASFGVATLRDGDDAETLVARADTALYQAKAQGRNRVVTATTQATAA